MIIVKLYAFLRPVKKKESSKTKSKPEKKLVKTTYEKDKANKKD